MEINMSVIKKNTNHQLSIELWEHYKNYLERMEYEILTLSYEVMDLNLLVKVPKYTKLGFDDYPHSSVTHLFILPSKTEFMDIIRLPILPSIPSKTVIEDHPTVKIDISDYPEGYFSDSDESKPSFIIGEFFKKTFIDNSVNKTTNKEISTKKTLFQKEVEYRESLVEYADKLRKKINDKWNEFQLKQDKANEEISLLIGGSSSEKLIHIANNKYELPEFLRKSYEVVVDTENQIAIIQFEFPDYAQENLIVKYIGGYPYKPKLATETVKKKLVKSCLYSMMIRSAFLAAKYSTEGVLKNIVVNVEQSWFDPATGQAKNGIIASLQASVEYLKSLDLSKLDPEVCFKYLKGISTPNLQNASPIRPIFTLNKEDQRLVANKDVDSYIEPEANLAAMEWEDFEHLVAQLFEWEFAKGGIEVRVTRASRDRGVDAILFDPDPLKGGKYVIQAKRYTRTVDVSAVRDLYGTVMNEGANRGILITTASYGPDAYEFANGKPISLVDGPNLLLMLQRHGKKFKIDLEEARQLNVINTGVLDVKK